ncbi:MAG: GAF domain-containing protein [Mycobacteriales bacterium]
MPKLPQLPLDDLLAELNARMQAVLATRDRVTGLLEAVLAIGANLDLDQVLHRIVQAAAELVGARYAALGVLNDRDEGLSQFITVGIDRDTIEAIGPYPRGKGILGVLISHPEPLRLADLADHPASVGFPANHPPMRTFLGAPIRVRGEVFGNLYLTEKHDGAVFDEDDEVMLTALATAAGVAIENARLYDQARRRERWLEASAEVVRQLLSDTPAGQILDLVAELAAEMSGAQLAALALPDATGRVLRVSHAAGTDADRFTGLALPLEGSLAGEAYVTGQVITSVDLTADQRATPVVTEAMTVGPALYAPIGEPGRVRGVLAVWNPAGTLPFEEATVGMLAAFARQAALGLELADRRHDAEQLTLLADRDRIARDLHDLALQRLFAAGMTLDSIARRIREPEIVDRVRQTADDIDETIKEIRTTVFALQSRADQAEPSLRVQVLQAVDQAAQSLGYTPSLRIEGLLDTTVPAELGDQALAVLREALSNTARHAHSRHVEVTVAAGENLTLTIHDDGQGISPEVTRRSGLANLVARADTLGGDCTITSEPGAGTTIRWQVPLS